MPWIDVLIVVKWYLILFVLGIVGWLLICNHTKNLPGFGYGAGRASGLVLIAGVSWILSTLGLLTFTPPILWGLLFLVFIFYHKRWKELVQVIKSQPREIIITELIFLTLFIIGYFLKSLKPAISDIEKYMDMALLNAVMRTEVGVPIDPWYAGSPVNYYYVGHWFIAVIAKMSNTISSYAFNLGFITVIAVSGINIVMTGWALSKRVWGGVLAVFLTLFISNIDPFLAWIKRTPDYFFYNSVRFIEHEINEYPFASFVIGEFHAHMLSLILTTLAILLSVLIFQNEKEKKFLVASLGFLVGLMFSVNAFDLINFGIYSGVVLTTYAIWKGLTFRRFIKTIFWFSVSASVPFLMFKINFVSPVGGIGIAIMKTPITHVLMQFGIFFALIFVSSSVLFFVYRKNKNRQNQENPKSWLGSFRSLSKETIAVGCIVLTGMILIVLSEFVFFKDIYFIQNPTFYRANTVFKVWYEAWVLLAITSGVLARLAYDQLSKFYHLKGKIFATVFIFIPIFVGSVGVVDGLKLLEDNMPNTLDGLAYINNPEAVQDYEIVGWARENISGQPIVLEATGQSYSTYNWFSAFTGLPTIIGWQSHEWGWRYEKDAWNKIAIKMGQVETIYKTTDPIKLKGLAEDSKISYVLVSPNEKNLYGVQDEVMKKAFGNPIFKTNKSALYKTDYDD